MDGGYRKKEKTHILQTWVVVVQRCIVLFSAVDAEFYQVIPAEPGIGDVILLLQVVQDGQILMLEACVEPFRQLRGSANPFA